MAPSRIVFLDRDGTLNVDIGYVTSPSQLEIIPGAVSALAKLCAAGFKLVIVTNQSAVARGLINEDQVREINAALLEEIAARDSSVKIEQVFFCPHHAKDNCLCRKPKTGMVEKFIASEEFDFQNSWMVGDKLMDLGFGENLGIPLSQNLLVLTGHGKAEFEKCSNSKNRKNLDNWHFKSIVEAVDFIVSKVSR
jgi:histidinol-phosphate phosphatase family protein